MGMDDDPALKLVIGMGGEEADGGSGGDAESFELADDLPSPMDCAMIRFPVLLGAISFAGGFFFFTSPADDALSIR